VEEKKNETVLLYVVFIPSLFRTMPLHKKLTFPNDLGLKGINSPCNLSRGILKAEKPAAALAYLTYIREVPSSDLELA
jgi:hypothetical protein